MMNRSLIFLLIVGAIILFSSNFAVAQRSFQLPTSLKITVIDNLGNFVEGADVTLFETEDDYRNETNPVAGPLKTDIKGRVKFRNIKAIVYFIHAVKDDKTNIGEGVQTGVLIKGKLNRVNTIIE